jgi:hypothetical protein
MFDETKNLDGTGTTEGISKEAIRERERERERESVCVCAIGEPL